MEKKPLVPAEPLVVTRLPIALRCLFCRDSLARGEALFCAACLAPHHEACFQDHGHCCAPGCLEQRWVRPGDLRPARRLRVASLILLAATLASAVAAWREHARASAAASSLAELRAAHADQRKAFKECQMIIAGIEEVADSGTRFLAGPPVPEIDARVTAIKTDVHPELVLLDVGSDDKVEKGFHFSIYRGSEFVGKVVVEKVLRDRCGCRVLFTREGESMQQGDSAATRLQ
jgi:hypothetical protein